MQRPLISEYEVPADYVRDMLHFRRKSDPRFSVLKASRPLRRVSPALVSLIVKKKRNVTLDRVDELARLLDLSVTEKFFFKHWIEGIKDVDPSESPSERSSRKVTGTSILSDWINLYVKDLFQIAAVRKDPSLAEKLLLSVATPRRVKKAITFLLREGHLRRTLDGTIVIDTPLSVTDPGVPSRKIRQFHKGALTLAKQALDLYSMQERFANTLLIALNDDGHQELRHLIQEFAERLQGLAAKETPEASRLFQVHLNLSPVGGKIE